MPGLMAKAVPWIAVVALVYGAYRLWMWAMEGGLSKVNRSRLVFVVFLMLALAVVVLAKTV